MEDDFDEIVDERHVVKSKPDPEIFLLAVEKLNIQTDSCIIFEDSTEGVIAAGKSGLYFVGIRLQQKLPDADLTDNISTAFAFQE